MKINLILLFLLFSFFSFSCKKTAEKQSPPSQDEICNTLNPLEELSWLKEIKTMFELRGGAPGAQIIAYKYNGSDVFWIDDCFGCDDNLIRIYNCTGEVICEMGGIAGLNTCPDFFEKASDSTMLFNYVQE